MTTEIKRNVRMKIKNGDKLLPLAFGCRRCESLIKWRSHFSWSDYVKLTSMTALISADYKFMIYWYLILNMTAFTIPNEYNMSLYLMKRKKKSVFFSLCLWKVSMYFTNNYFVFALIIIKHLIIKQIKKTRNRVFLWETDIFLHV